MSFSSNKNSWVHWIMFLLILTQLNTGFARQNTEDVTLKNNEMVILVHGLMRSSNSMKALKLFLEVHGYNIFAYDYPSTQFTIQQHGKDLEQFIQKLIVKNPKIKIHLITHSLGGIISREALAKLPPDQLKNIGYLIMLAPPSKGSFFAKLSTSALPIIKPFVKPLAQLSSDPSAYVHQVPIPKVKLAIIAGKYDEKVPPTSAYLDAENEIRLVPSAHTFIMDNSKTRNLILYFLKNGTFDSVT